MLSRLISLLRRIPAVKWAFTRLRPAPHRGSIDVTPVATDVSPDVTEDMVARDVAEAASPDLTDTSTVSAHGDAGITGAAASAPDETFIPVVAESLPAPMTDSSGSHESSRQAPSEIELVVEKEASITGVELESATADASDRVIGNDPAVEPSANVEPVELEPVAAESVSEPVAAAELVISSDPLPAPLTDAEPVVAEAASPSPVDIEIAPVDAPALVVDDARSSGVIVEVEPTLDEASATSANRDVVAESISEVHFDDDSSSGPAAAIEPAASNVAAPAAAVITAQCSSGLGSDDIESVPVLVSPSPERRSPKARARAAEPADRAALIRQRWAESGIRMWNPRLHGTGEAALNIQGGIGLLPPAPGETMPRYDKLEFKMLGGQIVCESVIVEAPVPASHRSFTRLAEPGKVERVREPARERQAALA